MAETGVHITAENIFQMRAHKIMPLAKNTRNIANNQLFVIPQIA